MGRWKIPSICRRSKRSSPPVHGSSSLNGTPCDSVPEPSHASDDIQIPWSHAPNPLGTTNSQSTAPLADPSASQLSDSEHVLAVVQNHTPSIAPSDVPSSSTSAVPSSSTPSSSVLKERDYIKQISGAVDAVDTRNVNDDLNDLSNYISQYLAFIKGEGDKPSPLSATKHDWPGSKCFFKLKDVLSEGAHIFKDVCPDAKTIAQTFLQGMGAVHMLTTGFLVVANIMERCEQIKGNKDECVSLLDKMNILIQYVKQLQKNPGLKEGMDTQIQKAINLIVEVTLACCTQINKAKYTKFFSTTVTQEELVNLKDKLSELRIEIQMQMGIHLNHGIEKIYNRLRTEVSYPRYPCAYGIENQVQNVIRLLEWERDETRIAVILYGLGGMGKTTLADAVFATLRATEMEGRKYSFVRLFENMGSVPNIPELQTCILRDLKMGEVSAIPKIQRYNEGQNEIADMLAEKEAFIYIDGVLFPDKVEQGRDAIGELLPTNMSKAKKLRLLITALDKGAAGTVCENRGLKTDFYPIETLPDSEATMLVNENLDGEEELIDSSQIKQIVDICGGIPRLLIQVATFIRNLQNKQEAQTRYEMVISKRKKEWNDVMGKEIARYVFAYEYFDEILRDPFLDICSYFQGWQWKELSNIFGDFNLNSLENRALVTKDVRSMTARVHKVILAFGLNKTEGERFKFTTGNEFEDFLNKTDEDLCGIKGIWSNDNIGPLNIPASKLDLMYRSLRVLALQNSTMVSGRCNRRFEELFFFSAKQISDIPFDPSTVQKLRHLCYSPDDFHNLCQGSSTEESMERNDNTEE